VSSTVRDLAAVAEPLMDVREILETFRRYHIVVDGWAEVLTRAASALDQVPAELEISASTIWIASELNEIVAYGLQHDHSKLGMVADRTAELLASIRVPGIPRPEDKSWEFS
jgi:hypothetical protein